MDCVTKKTPSCIKTDPLPQHYAVSNYTYTYTVRIRLKTPDPGGDIEGIFRSLCSKKQNKGSQVRHSVQWVIRTVPLEYRGYS